MATQIDLARGWMQKGPAAFVANDDREELLARRATVNSQAFRSLVDLHMAFGSFEAGVIQRTPIPHLAAPAKTTLATLANRAWLLKRALDTRSKTAHAFAQPALLQVPGTTLADRIASWESLVSETERQLADHQREIDDIAFRLYGIEGEDRRAIEIAIGSPLAGSTGEEHNEEDDA
jgi:hypothetical protein